MGIIFAFSLRWDLSLSIISQEATVFPPLFWPSCLSIECFAQFNTFLTWLPSCLSQMGCYMCAVRVCFGEGQRAQARFTVCVQICVQTVVGCAWGVFKAWRKKCILHENDTNCVFFLAFQGEGCRTVPLSGHVGFDSLPDQLVNKSVNHGFCFNILCVGEYFHLGKFCCWKGLLCSWV